MPTNKEFDILITNAKVFEKGLAPIIEDLGIKNGRIVARGKSLQGSAQNVFDASHHWLMPGLFDIHTHYDLELEFAPELLESVRHGTTTVVIANCSLGLAFGQQRRDGHDPIVSCYARVENIPKSVLKNCADKVDWTTPKAYLEHLSHLHLGPNVVPLLPHSMLRIEVMGFEDSISRDPTPQELERMKDILESALDDGYAGFSTDALPFHYLANHPHTSKTIPTQFAKYAEIKALTQIVREKERVWQATPPKDSVVGTLKTLFLTSGRFFNKPLKTTVVAALRITNNWKLMVMTKVLAKLLNSSLVKGKFYMQALGASFKTWSDGAITPLAEEIPELRRLNETDLEDREARLNILTDPTYVKAFKDMWLKGKTGFSIARLKRLFNLEDFAFHRDLSKMWVDKSPIDSWQGQSLLDIYTRMQTQDLSKFHADELDIAEAFAWIEDEADFMLQLLRSFDTQLSWYTVTANEDANVVRDLIMNPLFIPGFNDSGAHLTNMAFYDANLRSLQLAAKGGDLDVSYMVKRLTQDAAELFGISGGTLDIGAQADLVIIDPKELEKYHSDKHTQRVYKESLQHEQLVNRSDNVVSCVVINGEVAWQNNSASDQLGKKQFGQLKTAV